MGQLCRKECCAYAGGDSARHEAIEWGWRNLCGSGIAYGLTEGGYNASEITLSSLGARIVRPTVEGDDVVARREALLKPRVLREFLQKYDEAKFPRDQIAENVLIDLGLPKERAPQALDILKDNCRYAGILAEIKGDSYVMLQGAGLSPEAAEIAPDNGSGNFEPEREHESAGIGSNEISRPLNVDGLKPEVLRVFITHGKNIKILGQIEKIVRYGGFTPVIAKDHETSAKPVPDKVLADMRSCQAAVIHVGSEGVLYDEDSNKCPQINGNVLIEIGIARASYGNKFILLVEEGVQLPSNLQGLYECRYHGDELNMEATMKLLEAFNDFKGNTGKAAR